NMGDDYPSHWFAVRRHAGCLGNLDFITVLEWSRDKAAASIANVNLQVIVSAVVTCDELIKPIRILATFRIGTGGRHLVSGRIRCGDAMSSWRNESFRKQGADRKSTRLNSSHSQISYAVFCLKKKTQIK